VVVCAKRQKWQLQQGMNGHGDNCPLVPSRQLLQIRAEIYWQLRLYCRTFPGGKLLLSLGIFTVLSLFINTCYFALVFLKTLL